MSLLKKLNIRNPLLINLLIVGSVTLVVKLAGLFKETYIGSSYGLSEFLDTYALALLIPSFIQNVFVGAIKNIFIPNYIIEKKNDRQIGGFQTLTCLLILGINFFFGMVLLVSSSFLLEIIFPDHTPEYYALINKQLVVLLPCLFIWGLNGFLSALLEIENKFFYTSIAPIYTSIVTILAIYFFKDRLGDYVLAVSILAGSLASFIHLFAKAIKLRLIQFGRLRLNHNMRVMLQQLPAKVISGLLTGINPIVDQFFAAQLVAGSVIALAYGEKIPAFGISIAMIALGNVLLPHFAELVSKDLKKAYKELFKILKIAFFASLIFSVLMIFFSDIIIRILFERNSFTSKDTEIVSFIQQLLLIHVPFFVVTRILVKFLTSINKNGFMAWVSALSVLTNLLLNYLLIHSFQVYGLALSTSLVLIINSLVFLWFTIRQYKSLQLS